MITYSVLNRTISGRNRLELALKVAGFAVLLTRTFLLKYTLFLTSYIVPKNRKILFFSSVGAYKFPLWKDEDSFQFKESPKYLAIYSAKKLKDHLAVFHVPNRKMFPQIERLGIKPTAGLRAFWYMLRAKYLFIDNTNFFNPNASFLLGNFNIVQCWHGTPLKRMGLRRASGTAERILEIIKKCERRKYRYFICTCEHATQVYKSLYPKAEMPILGYPRNDILFDRDFFATEDLRGITGSGRFSKLILYAPTFRRVEQHVNPFDECFLETLNTVLQENNYLFLIKQHPYAKAVQLAQDFSNIKDVSTEVDDIQELLVHVDVLISDYSSVIFDFSLTEKLQLFYPFDLETYKKQRGEFHFEYCSENLPGVIIADPADFIEKVGNLETIIADSTVQARIKHFKHKYNTYTDGNSCQRIFEWLKITPQA